MEAMGNDLLYAFGLSVGVLIHMLHIIEKHAALLQALAGVASAAAAIILLVVTWRYVRLTGGLLTEQRLALAAQYEPLVMPVWLRRASRSALGEEIYQLQMHNEGRGTAFGIHVSVTHAGNQGSGVVERLAPEKGVEIVNLVMRPVEERGQIPLEERAVDCPASVSVAYRAATGRRIVVTASYLWDKKTGFDLVGVPRVEGSLVVAGMAALEKGDSDASAR
jgi:hypothetical protein